MKQLIIVFFASILFNVQGQEMKTNFEEAVSEAKAHNEQILLVFTGSDWCVPCMKLEKNILSTEEFQKAIEGKYVLINADFPQKKKNKALQSEELQAQNKKLASQYNKKGYFPLVVVLDTDLQVKGKMTYEEVSPKEFANKIAAFVN